MTNGYFRHVFCFHDVMFAADGIHVTSFSEKEGPCRSVNRNKVVRRVPMYIFQWIF